MQKKILLVDAETSLRRTLASGLNRHGIDTEPCENGINALKKLDTFIKNNISLDGIVVDLKLPDIEGVKLARIMKFKCPSVPIILITGYADLCNMEEIRELQVDAFMEKPFTADELFRQFEKILEARKTSETPDIETDKKEAVSESAYLLLTVDEEAGFFDTYQELYYMDNVVYCDAVKGDYDIFLLVQAENKDKIREIIESKVKKVKGVKTVDLLEVGQPVLDDGTLDILRDAEVALEDNFVLSSRNRDLSVKVCSYLLMDVEREKLDGIYLTLRLDKNVVYCDCTSGKYNLVLFITGCQFDEIDRFITEKIIYLDGVLKVKEYPILNLFEM